MLRREHAARRAVRARRRHPGPGAGGRLRPRHRRPQRASRRSGSRWPPAARTARFEIVRAWTSAAAGCRSRCPTASPTTGLPSIAGQRIATTYPHMLERFLRENAHRGRDRHAVGRGRDRAAPRPRRPDLRPRLDGSTLQANHLREVATVLESQAVLIRTPVRAAARKGRLGRAPAAAHRRRAAGHGEQVHHAARAALGAAARSRQLLPGSESPTVIPLEGSRRQGRGARRVPRERVLGDAREPEGRRRQRRAGAAGREDAGMSATLQILDWSTLDDDERRRAAAPAGAARRGGAARARRARSSARCAPTAMPRCASTRQRFDGVRARLARGQRRRSSTRPRPRSRASSSPRCDRAIENVTRFHEAQSLRARARGDRARRALRARVRADRRRRPVRAGRHRAAALHRHHAGGAGAARRLPGARAVHAAAARRPRRRGGAARPRDCAASSTSSSSAARRPSRRWPTARRACPKVDKIFGPGNAWVTAAKQIVAADADGAALDMPAGPSEVLVIADDAANAEFVAADLLAQAEHGADAQVVLVTTSRELADAVHRRGRAPARRAAARARSLRAPIAGSRVILVADLETALEVSQPLRARAPDPAGRARRAAGSSACAPPARCSSAPGRRSPWATTAAAPTTCCRPTATRAPTAASACSTSCGA